MTHAYDSEYLDDAMRSLGEAMEYAANSCGINMDDFLKLFISTGHAQQFAAGVPKYLSGTSGTELAMDVFTDSGLQIELQKPRVDYDYSKEYWCGWILAYYQWYANRTFQEIVAVVSLSEMRSWYPTLHEADIMRFVDAMNQRLATRPTNLEILRNRAKLSQAMLSQLSGVSLRSIQMYEQRQNDISRAQFNILNALARTLGCTIYDLMDSDVSTQQNPVMQDNPFMRKLQQDMEQTQRKLEQIQRDWEYRQAQLQAYRYGYASQLPHDSMTPSGGYQLAPNAFQQNWNQYWGNVLAQQRMAEEQRQRQQKLLQAIAKEAIGQAIKATGNKPAELVYNTACLFTSDNLLEATNNAIKVIQNVDEISRS